jgi:hypothetical protein
MIPFALPPLNPPHRPPKETGPVAIWHVREGLIRGWYGGGWFRPGGPLDLPIPDREVLGWWPGPEPVPDIECTCHGCGEMMSIPVTLDKTGSSRPDVGAAPEGWRYTVIRKGILIPFIGWLCPTCPLPENPDG